MARRGRISDAKAPVIGSDELVSFVVEPDIRTFKALKDHMAMVHSELARLRDAGGMDERLIQRIELLSDLFAGTAPEGTIPQLKAEDDMIDAMDRL